jgi:hypothetical protein
MTTARHNQLEAAGSILDLGALIQWPPSVVLVVDLKKDDQPTISANEKWFQHRNFTERPRLDNKPYSIGKADR